MLDWISWNGLKAIRRVYKKTIRLIIISLLISLYVLINEKIINSISIIIGFAGLCIATYSIESTTSQLNDIQADYWNTKGVDAYKRGKYYDSLQAFDKAMTIDKKSIKCRINKANALQEKNKRYGNTYSLIEANKVIEEAISLGPKYPASPEKNTPEELKARQECANAFKTHCDILLGLSNMQNNQELYSYAIRASKEAICIYEDISRHQYPCQNPELPGAWISRGNALSSNGEYDRAIDAYDRAINMNLGEENAFAWAAKAGVLSKKGEFKKADEAINKAIELKPDSSVYWYHKGNNLLNMARHQNRNGLHSEANRDYRNALHAYNKSTAFNPMYLNAWHMRGNSLMEQGDYIEAINSYDNALDINPQDQDALNKRAEATERLAINNMNNITHQMNALGYQV